MHRKATIINVMRDDDIYIYALGWLLEVSSITSEVL